MENSDLWYVIGDLRLQQTGGLRCCDASAGLGELTAFLTLFYVLSRLAGARGAIAQLGERYNGIVEVGGSIPPGSTTFSGGVTDNCPHRLEA